MPDLGTSRTISPVYENSIATLREALYAELASITAENQLKEAFSEVFPRLNETRLIRLIIRQDYSKETAEFLVSRKDIFLMIAHLLNKTDRRCSIMLRFPTYIAMSRGNPQFAIEQLREK